ncbi:MAG: hypothetical protein QXK65_00320 [Candidatus Micrarchaeaceae archaeon]
MIGKKAELKGNALINEVVNLIEDRKKAGELTYEQQRAYDHAKALVKKRRYPAIKKELEALGMLSEDAIAKVLEIYPKDKTLLSQLLIKEKRVFNDEDKEKILSILNK